MTAATIATQRTNRSLPAVSLISALLLALSFIGGPLAVMMHVNRFADAFGNKAEMAAPWPMLALTLAGALAAARWRGWRGVVGTVAVLIPSALALGSIGDDETFKHGLPTFTYVYQVTILTASAVAVVICIAHLRKLQRGSR